MFFTFWYLRFAVVKWPNQAELFRTFFITITPTTICNQKSKFLENLYTHHLFVIFFMKNNQSLFYLFGPLCNTALPLHTQPFLFFLAILELNFLALLSSFMIPSGLISHSRKVKRPLHDTFVSRDRKKCCWSKIYGWIRYQIENYTEIFCCMHWIFTTFFYFKMIQIYVCVLLGRTF